MATLDRHWTNRGTPDFVYRIGFDFVAQLELILEDKEMSREDLARALGVSKGRVSQVLNNPGNLRLGTIVEFARSLGRKVSIVVYDDNDATNDNGPINSAIFEQCWIASGKPTEFADLGAWEEMESTDEREWAYVEPTTRIDIRPPSAPYSKLLEAVLG